MTIKTRNRVLVCLVVAGIAVPAESILLPAAMNQTVNQQAQQWANNQDAKALDDAADNIQSYPFAYRRAIMKNLSPEKRAKVWKKHVKTYLDSHPELGSDQVAALDGVMSLLTASTFSSTSPALRAEITEVGDQVKALLGANVAEYLLQRLGPADGQYASAEPWNLRLARRVRAAFVANADEAADCECTTQGTCSTLAGLYCGDSTTCTVDNDWPMCGWLWDYPCDGMCKFGWPQ